MLHRGSSDPPIDQSKKTSQKQAHECAPPQIHALQADLSLFPCCSSPLSTKHQVANKGEDKPRHRFWASCFLHRCYELEVLGRLNQNQQSK